MFCNQRDSCGVLICLPTLQGVFKNVKTDYKVHMLTDMFVHTLLLRTMEIKDKQEEWVIVGGSWVLDLDLVVFELLLNEN